MHKCHLKFVKPLLWRRNEKDVAGFVCFSRAAMAAGSAAKGT